MTKLDRSKLEKGTPRIPEEIRRILKEGAEAFDALTESLNKLRKTQNDEIDSGRKQLGEGETQD